MRPIKTGDDKYMGLGQMLNTNRGLSVSTKMYFATLKLCREPGYLTYEYGSVYLNSKLGGRAVNWPSEMGWNVYEMGWNVYELMP